MMLIITSTEDDFLRNVNIDDLKPPPSKKGFSKFFPISDCDTHFKSELHRNG